MRRNYSRLSSVEEKRNVKNALFFIGLSVILLIVLFFVGIPTLGKFLGFVSDVGKNTNTISTNDKTPPGPPRFNPFPDFTNQRSITLTGNSEPGSTIKLTFNSSEQTTLADKDGNFSFGVSLSDGENNFTATATDGSKNVSTKSSIFKITFDDKAPDLTIDNPADGSSFFGSKQQTITIHGTTEINTQVTINDRIVAVDDSGKFQFTTTLNSGENKFTIKSTDLAGNITQKDITLTYSE